jgi:hypothetical protein
VLEDWLGLASFILKVLMIGTGCSGLLLIDFIESFEKKNEINK